MPPQTAIGEFNALAESGGTAIVNAKISKHYHAAAPKPANTALIEMARFLLAGMPLDKLPERAALPPGSNMPFHPNRQFVGRAEEIQRLADLVKNGGAAVVGQSPVISGTGGIGKTQLATELVWRYGQYFKGGVFWISFAEEDSIAAEIGSCGINLNLHPDFSSLPLETQVSMVSSRWQDGVPRLLIFDNCENSELFRTWCPPSGDCRIVLTSRMATWPRDLGLSSVSIEMLSREESISLLLNYRPDLEPSDQDLGAIAEELGDLPLALHLAGSYLARYQNTDAGSPPVYLAELRATNVLEHPSLTTNDITPTGHDSHVGRTFSLSTSRLNPADCIDAFALKVICAATHFAPGEPIPHWLLSRAIGLREDKIDDQRQFSDAVSRLQELGLVEIADDGPSLHRLVSLFATTTLNADAQLEAVEIVVGQAAAEQIQAKTPDLLHERHVHLVWIAENATARGSAAAGDLMLFLGQHLYNFSDFIGAKAAFEKSYTIREKFFGQNHPFTNIALNNIGITLKEIGDFEKAKEIFELVITWDEKNLGADHPNVATAINNLGLVLKEMGDYEEAIPAFERALNTYQEVCGSESAQVAITMNNLGLAYQAQGNYEKSQAIFESALDLSQKVTGPESPTVANTLANLGLALQERGDLAGARGAFERALEIDKKIFGENHPTVANRINSLGLLLHRQGDFPGGKSAFERALRIDEANLGRNHPTIAKVLNNLGLVLLDSNDLDEALTIFQRALEIDKQYYDQGHAYFAIRFNNLGRVYHEMGNFQEAKSALENALAIDERVFGPNHPNVATTLGNLGRVLIDLDEIDSAYSVLERALSITENTFGTNHVYFANLLAYHGDFFRRLEEMQKAKDLYERAIAIYDANYDVEHPRLIQIKDRLRSLKV